MKLKIFNDILTIDIVSLLLTISILFIPSTAVRVALGLPFLLFFPGYTLLAVIFVKKGIIDVLERLALSTGLSIVIVGLIGLILNYTTWGITLEPILILVSSFIFITSAVALSLEVRIEGKIEIVKEITISLPDWGGSIFNRILSFIIVISLFCSLGVLAYTILNPKHGELFSEFYMLGISGKPQDYPTEFIMDQDKIIQVKYGNGTLDTVSGMGKLTLGIVNHEQQDISYHIKITINDESSDIYFNGATSNLLGPIELKHGEKWENSIGFIPRQIGSGQKVVIMQFINDNTTPDNTLHFWINVKAE
jgi:uncharacterized membrane protein